MRESETVLQGLGHLPGALITLGASGFGAKKLAGATGRKALGELATRTIEPISYGGKLKEMFGVLRNPSSLKSLAVLEGYHKMDAVNLGRMFAYRKAFNLKPPKESLGMFKREGKKQYSLNMKNDKSRQLGLDVITSQNHPVFGNYTKRFKPKVVKGKPAVETSYKDRWDWDFNPGEIKEMLSGMIFWERPYKAMLTEALPLLAQRAVAAKLSKPITFKGTISGKDYMNLLGLPKSLSFVGTTQANLALERYLTSLKQILLEGSGMAKKPSKAWWKSYDNMLERLLKNKHDVYDVNALYGLPKGTKNAAGQVIR